MSFKIVLLPPDYHQDWPQRIQEAVPTAQVRVFSDPVEAFEDIVDADCAYGYVPPELFARAGALRWIQCYAAGPDPSFYHEALVNSQVMVTNFRGIYNDGVSHHAMALLLGLSRDFHQYMPLQLRKEWRPGEEAGVHLPGRTVVVIGVGGIGAEIARLCKCFGMVTVGIDPNPDNESDSLDELHLPENLDQVIPGADFVVVTTPDTPQTRGMINTDRLSLMKSNAFLINVGRGVCVVLEDLVEVLRSRRIAGAALDVFEIEPLPPDHPLWEMDNLILTPHTAAHKAPYMEGRRNEIFIGNCARFAGGEPLLNVVDKQHRY